VRSIAGNQNKFPLFRTTCLIRGKIVRDWLDDGTVNPALRLSGSNARQTVDRASADMPAPAGTTRRAQARGGATTFWHQGVSWRSALSRYERGCMLVMWLGQAALGACLAVAIAALLLDIEPALVDGTLAFMPIGFAVFFVTRSLLALSVARRTRHDRRRRVRLRQI
jgi:hypothetical protein